MTQLKEIAMSGHRPSMTQATVRDRVFELFRAFRTTTIFGNPGSTELPMFRDFPADFRYVLGLAGNGRGAYGGRLCPGDPQCRAGEFAFRHRPRSRSGCASSPPTRNQTPLVIAAEPTPLGHYGPSNPERRFRQNRRGVGCLASRPG